MAEVGQRLGSGAYRLSALRTGHSRPMSTGGSPGSLPVNGASGHGRVTEKSVQDQHEVQPLSGSKTTRRKSGKVSRLRQNESLQENVILLRAPSVGLSSSTEAYKTALYFSAGLLQGRLTPWRLTPWTRGDVSIHPDTFRSTQQLRAFCTVVFILTEPGSERPGCGHRLRRLRLHPDFLKASTTARSYSWRSEDAALRHKSKSSYYDILKVSPGATQSQIKTAYYKQSFIYHPDKNPGSKEATERFSEISEAYSVLGNISLRRRYDRGILSQADVQSAGRPSSKEKSRPTGSPQQQQQQYQQRARRFSQAGGKPMFDFDAFFRAHYGEQLQRERIMKAMKQQMEKKKKEMESSFREEKIMEMTVLMVLTVAGLFLISFTKS